MLTRRIVLASLALAAPLLLTVQARAQDATTNVVKKTETTDIPVALDKPSPNGVFGSLRGDATLNLNDNQSVVGQPNGMNLNLGVKIDGKVDVIQAEHEWRNSVLINAGITRTPNIDEFIKNTDALQLESIYLYHVKPWFGPFARFRLETPMFSGTDVRPGATNYKITQQDGTVVQTCDPDSGEECTTTKFPLTSAFKPLTLKESIGVFAQPYKSDPISVEARVGVGGQQILVDKQYAVADLPDAPENCPAAGDPTTKSAIPCVEVSQLSDVLQIGLEANLEVWGTVYEGKITYKVYGGILAPFAHGDLPVIYTAAGGQDDVGQLTNIDLGANINFRLTEWASLGYEIKAVRVPQLLPDTFQVRNSFFLTMGYGVDNKPAPPPPPAPPAATPAST